MQCPTSLGLPPLQAALVLKSSISSGIVSIIVISIKISIISISIMAAAVVAWAASA